MITYFIQSGEYVKIGRTRNIHTRMPSLQTNSAHKLELLKICDMSEKDAHNHAATISHREAGEWFRINPDLIDWISSLKQSSANPSKKSGGKYIYQLTDETKALVDAASAATGLKKCDVIRLALDRGVRSLVAQLGKTKSMEVAP